jgi:hypothetical protein
MAERYRNPKTGEEVEWDGSTWRRVAEARATPEPAVTQAVPGGYMTPAAGRVESVLQGATLGTSDEMQAGLGALYDATQGKPLGESYTERQKALQTAYDAYRAQHPVADIAGNLAGGVATGTLAAKAGGSILPRAAARLPLWVKAPVAGGTAGAVAGAMSAKPGERAQGAVIGGVAGAGAALVTTAALGAAKSLARRSGLAGSKGARQVADAFTKDDVSLDEAQARLAQLGPDAVPADTGGPNVLGQAWRVASQPGPGKAIAKRVLDERDVLQAERILAPVEGSLGKGSEAYGTLAETLARRSEAAKPLYAQAHATVVESLTPTMKRVLATPNGKKAWADAARKAANDVDWPAKDIPALDDVLSGKVVPDFRTLDYVKQSLDDVVSDNTDALTGKVNSVGRTAHRHVKLWLKDMDDMSRTYKEARAVWAGETQAMGSLRRGMQFMKNPHEMTTADIADLSEADQAMFRLGAARAIQDMIDRAGDTHDVTRRVWGNKRVRDTLRAVFPNEDSWDEFSKVVEQEAVKRRTRNAVQGNSLTAERQAIQAEQGADVVAGPMLSLAMGRPGDAAQGFLTRIMNRLRPTSMSPEESSELAGLLFSQSPAAQAQAFDMLRRPAALQGLLGAVGRAQLPLSIGLGSTAGMQR